MTADSKRASSLRSLAINVEILVQHNFKIFSFIYCHFQSNAVYYFCVCALGGREEEVIALHLKSIVILQSAR